MSHRFWIGGCRYPGIYIDGEEALGIAGWLRASPEERERMARGGAGWSEERIASLLEECLIEPPPVDMERASTSSGRVLNDQRDSD